MDILLSHTTALEVVRRWDSFRLMERGALAASPAPPPSAPGSDELRAALALDSLAGAGRPLHVLVARGVSRNRSALVVPHVALDAYPPGSFFALAPGVFCSSPELVALQMTEYATDLELLLLLDELCGHYGVQPHASSGLVARRVPLTTPERIGALAAGLGAADGLHWTARARPLVMEGALDYADPTA